MSTEHTRIEEWAEIEGVQPPPGTKSWQNWVFAQMEQATAQQCLAIVMERVKDAREMWEAATKSGAPSWYQAEWDKITQSLESAATDIRNAFGLDNK